MIESTISALYIYPIKSCAAVQLQRAKCTESGLEHDRNWVVVSAADHRMLTQRDYPRMALIRPLIENGSLTLTADGVEPSEPISSGGGGETEVSVWGRELVAVDQGSAASQWLSQFLSIRCKLLRTSSQSFFDVTTLLIMSEASVDDLNNRLPVPVPMSRFRPSIVLRGIDAYAEDKIVSLSSSGLEMTAVKPCGRCIVVNVDQETGSMAGAQPLETLVSYRREGTKAMFGHYFLPSNSGVLQVGSPALAQLR